MCLHDNSHSNWIIFFFFFWGGFVLSSFVCWQHWLYEWNSGRCRAQHTQNITTHSCQCARQQLYGNISTNNKNFSCCLVTFYSSNLLFSNIYPFVCLFVFCLMILFAHMQSQHDRPTTTATITTRKKVNNSTFGLPPFVGASYMTH